MQARNPCQGSSVSGVFQSRHTRHTDKDIAFIMQSTHACLYIFVFGIMVIRMSSSKATNRCPLSQNVVELKRYYETIKDILDTDKVTNIRLLRASALNRIHVSEKCCLLLKLGTFYVTNVFPQLDFNYSKTHRGFTNIANSMLGLKQELKHCHATMRCPCGEQAHTAMEKFKNDYYKLKTQDATLKAVGEMNILFHWIEKNF
ncbi:interleukin-20-like [Hyla sarda]|uniref:interleukin-20-like n=1 Tax=Hyla sarda TaxID=327740 RepID=UPI0024C3CA5D|nr:interleukin-20-like [Hyla sarda]